MVLAWLKAYVTAHENTSIIALTIRERSRIILSIEKALPALTDKARFENQNAIAHADFQANSL